MRFMEGPVLDRERIGSTVVDGCDLQRWTRHQAPCRFLVEDTQLRYGK